jgi:hypothetical protein
VLERYLALSRHAALAISKVAKVFKHLPETSLPGPAPSNAFAVFKIAKTNIQMMGQRKLKKKCRVEII